MNDCILSNSDIRFDLKEINPIYNDETSEIMCLNDIVATQANSCTCTVCFIEIAKVKMREHIARHIIVGDLVNNVNTCGYCGNEYCNIELRKTTGSFSKPFSNCKFHVNFNLKSAGKSTKSKPGTNRPVKCDRCQVTVWSYNIDQHYLSCHPGVEAPVMITEKERAALRALEHC